MSRAELPELLSVADVAAWLRKTPKAIRVMRCRGQLPPAIDHPQLGGVRWRRADLLEWFCRPDARISRSRDR